MLLRYLKLTSKCTLIFVHQLSETKVLPAIFGDSKASMYAYSVKINPVTFIQHVHEHTQDIDVAFAQLKQACS